MTAGAAPGSIIAAIITAHTAIKKANEPGLVATPMSIPVIRQTATTQQAAAVPSVTVSTAAVVAVRPLVSAEREAGACAATIGGVSMAVASFWFRSTLTRSSSNRMIATLWQPTDCVNRSARARPPGPGYGRFAHMPDLGLAYMGILMPRLTSQRLAGQDVK